MPVISGNHLKMILKNNLLNAESKRLEICQYCLALWAVSSVVVLKQSPEL